MHSLTYGQQILRPPNAFAVNDLLSLPFTSLKGLSPLKTRAIRGMPTFVGAAPLNKLSNLHAEQHASLGQTTK